VKIYVLKQRHHVGYDEAGGFVVIAPDARQARKLAARHSGDEGGACWTSPQRSTCRVLDVGIGSRARLVLTDFRAG
jgi:hypothetical protein